jgi:diazepam-binding inhibitor (GABA receptor modulating acyl-CoA-binding protein)
MTGAKYQETYKKVSAMGEKLKAAGKQGPSNDEQLHVSPTGYFFGIEKGFFC